jgi:hypothetical protein
MRELTPFAAVRRRNYRIYPQQFVRSTGDQAV